MFFIVNYFMGGCIKNTSMIFLENLKFFIKHIISDLTENVIFKLYFLDS